MCHTYSRGKIGDNIMMTQETRELLEILVVSTLVIGSFVVSILLIVLSVLGVALPAITSTTFLVLTIICIFFAWVFSR